MKGIARTIGNAGRLVPLLAILSPCACAITAQSELSVEPVYVVYKIRVTNRKFPPGHYSAKMNVFYDAGRLWYVKNEDTFYRYGGPEILLTDRGLQIDFKSLPSNYTGPSGDMALYFLPLAVGTGCISGEFLSKKKQMYLGPRHRVITQAMPSLEFTAGRSFDRKETGRPGFLDRMKKLGVPASAENLKGKHTRIFIPTAISGDRAGELLQEALSGHGFDETGSVRFPDGLCRTYLRVVPDKKQVVELRAALEYTRMGRNLHLLAYGTEGVDELFDAVEARYRGLVGE